MSRYPDISLSVVLPAYNEEKNIEATLPRAVSALREVVGRFELLLINDKSTDRTGELAEQLANQLPEVRVIHNERNLGQGGSLRHGFSLCRFDWVTHNAMDYPFDFLDLPVLLKELPAGVVLASRREYAGVGAVRRLMSFANRTLLRLLFGASFVDYNFIQIYRRDLAQDSSCFSTATVFITPEMILRAHQKKERIVEVIIEYHPRLQGKATSASWRNIRRGLSDMLRLWSEFRRGERAP